MVQLRSAPRSATAHCPPGSGERSLADVEQRLRGLGYAALRHVKIEMVDGAVVLKGVVPSYYMKQLAQESVRHVLGDLWLKNHIRVVDSPS